MIKAVVPPIKSQGIKTKLVNWIANSSPKYEGKWIEPFVGTGVVSFSLKPHIAILGDTNPHLIRFYTAIQNGEITPESTRDYLEYEGEKLRSLGENHYYFIRDRFNLEHNPLDFLFINRACFNGVIRFNKKQKFNTPFCRKPNRFAPAYITKIVNQVSKVSDVMMDHKFQFHCQSFEVTMKQAQKEDVIYCDPPYIGRHSGYFNQWTDSEENVLFDLLVSTHAQFMLSTWHHNKYRRNTFIDRYKKHFNVLTEEHFYHVAGKSNNRGTMVEALITNFDVGT